DDNHMSRTHAGRGHWTMSQNVRVRHICRGHRKCTTLVLSTTNFFISVIFIQHTFLFSRRCVVIYYAIYDLCLSQCCLRKWMVSPNLKNTLIASNGSTHGKKEATQF